MDEKSKKKPNNRLNETLIEKLCGELRTIRPLKIRIECEFVDFDIIKKIVISKFSQVIEVYSKSSINKTNLNRMNVIAQKNNTQLNFRNKKPLINKNYPISIKNLNVDIINFFLCKVYNPCWGKQIAIDSIGDIFSKTPFCTYNPRTGIW